MLRKILFSSIARELLVSTAITKVVSGVIRNNVFAQNTLHKLLRLTGEVVLISIVTDYALDHVDQKVAAMKNWWKERKENAAK